MASYIWETMTQANADAFTSNDVIVFTTAGATGAATVVQFVPATATTPASVSISFGGKSLSFDAADVQGRTNLAVYPDGSVLYVGSTGPDNGATSGGENSDGMYGGNGNDTLGGGNGADLLHGNLGDDSLNGGGGADSIYGGQGDDDIVMGAGGFFGHGNLGDDSLDGSAGSATTVQWLYGG